MKTIFIIMIFLLAQSFVTAQSIVWRQIIGDRYNDQGFNCIQLRDESYLMAGYSEILIPGTSFIIPKPYIVKFDRFGNIIWKKLIGDSLNGGAASTLIEDTYGNIYLTTYSSTSFLIKLDSNGNSLWSKNYFDYNIEVLKGIAFSGNNKNLILLSQTNGTSSITKLDSSGNLIWNKSYYDSIPFYHPYFSGHNSFYFAEEFYLISGASGNNGFIIKTDTSGNILWNNRYNNWGVYSISRNTENSFICSCQADEAGNLFCQEINSNGDLIWERNYANDSSAWGMGFRKILKTSDNNFVLGTTAGHNFGRYMKINSLGNILSSNFYYYPVNFAIGQNNINNTFDSGYITVGYLDSNSFLNSDRNLAEHYGFNYSKNISVQKRIDALIFKIDKDGKTVFIGNNNSIISEEPSINVYPNPFNLSFRISLKILNKTAVRILLFDVSGRRVKEIEDIVLNTGDYMFSVNTPELGSGVYFLKTDINNKSFSKKILLIK